MSQKITIKNFVETYKKKELIIPMIQRNYKWKCGADVDWNKPGERNTAHNLVQEIAENALSFKLSRSNVKDKVLGIIVLYQQEDSDTYQILDGQQRIITLSLIWRFLKDNIQNSTCEWIKYSFNRDYDDDKKREKFMFWNTDCANSVDVKRMKENYEEIAKVLRAYNQTNNLQYADVWEYILQQVYVVVRETETPPIDEFLNINSFKTPFSICDYVKVFLLQDAQGKKQQIIELYQEISSYLYAREIDKQGNISNNKIFEMVSLGYNNIVNNKTVNRLDLLFEDSYNYRNIETKKIEVNEILSKYQENNAADGEIRRLYYFHNVLKGIYEELNTKDPDGRKHPNYNAFNAFYVLNKYKNKRFFAIFSEDDINNSKDPNGVMKEFCLQEFCATHTNKLANSRAVNAFIQSVCYSSVTVCEQNEFEISNEEDFCKIKDLFFHYHQEYTDIIIKGKEFGKFTEINDERKSSMGNGTEVEMKCQEILENGTITIHKLLMNTSKVIIPNIQRDYIQGSNAQGFIDHILKKYAEQMVEKLSNNLWWEKIINILADKIKKFDDNCALNIGASNKNFKDNKELSKKVANKILKKYIEEALLGNQNIYFWSVATEDFYSRSDLDMRYNCNNTAVLLQGLDKYIEPIKEECNLINDVSYTASCVVGFEDEKKCLYIYDGQQRLTTFLCIIGYLKRKTTTNEYDELYTKFKFEGRESANKALETLYKFDKDKSDNVLLKELGSLVCNQTTESIYNIVESLSKLLKERGNLYIPISYFWNNMKVELFLIDKLDEATQLFMDLNSGLKLESAEIYKAELNHYFMKVENSNNKGCVSDIQRHIDNELIDYYIKETNPEEKTIATLKNLIKWTYIERYHDIKWSEFQNKNLRHYYRKFDKGTFLKDLYSRMKYVKDNRFEGITIMCGILEECICKRDYRVEKINQEIRFYFKKNDFLQKRLDDNRKIPDDMELKIKYDLSSKGYIKVNNDFETKYNLSNTDEEGNLNSLLKSMSHTKQYNERLEGEKFKRPEASLPSGIHTWNKDKESLLDSVVEDNDLENLLEIMFYGKEMQIDLSQLKNEIIGKMEKGSIGDKVKISQAMIERWDIIKDNSNKIYYWNNNDYVEAATDSFCVSGILISKENVQVINILDFSYRTNVEKMYTKIISDKLLYKNKLERLLLLLMNQYGFVGGIEGSNTNNIVKKDNSCCFLIDENQSIVFVKNNEKWVVKEND